MSLRYMSRVLYQGGMRLAQGMKDQGAKCDYSNIKSLRDSAASSSKQARRFSSCSDSPAFRASSTSDKIKQAEHSLRIVMYLSCWAPT